ncbi:MAG: hypothetical protein A2V52_08180 [Actinobacteria bacterium RBG_19FT_COMBO_54_7]|nr:MAG: hypothetical protein A2V52_08180 [Actinobacteria bacterium RBG_19FT_COMBO_54_7]
MTLHKKISMQGKGTGSNGDSSETKADSSNGQRGLFHGGPKTEWPIFKGPSFSTAPGTAVAAKVYKEHPKQTFLGSKQGKR